MVEQIPEKKAGNIWPVLLILFTIMVAVAVILFFLLFVINEFELKISLEGDQEMSINLDGEYVEPGAEALLVGDLFFRDGLPLDVDVLTNGQVDPSVPGDYEIYYGAMFHNLSASERRIVRVLDQNAPKITLISVPGSYTIPGEAYEEEGFSAWDDCDGDLTSSVIREEKDGFVTYTVADRGGNVTYVSRKIYYFDPVPPEITLIGDSTVYVNAGENYTDPGWTAVDNKDGDISDRVEITGTVDKYLAGSYVLTYTAKDVQGNAASVERTVVVVPRGIPKTVPPEGKVIYLTFDDGPGPFTRELLEILEKYGAKATFFVVNTDYVNLIDEIVEAGHSIGIHSMSHTYQEIYDSAEAYFNDILSMQQLIYDECGVKTYLMRFPGGSSNTVSRFNPGIMTYLTQAVEDNGFCYFDWNVDSNDAGGARNAEDVFENVIAGVKNRRISIVLQHDIKGFSVDAVEKILQWGKENGYQFLALDMSSPRAHHGVNN